MTIDSGLAQMPSSFLSLAEMNVRQAREAFDGFICASRRGAALLEWRATAVQSGANDIRQMSIGFAERNVIASLNFAQRLVQAESVPQIVDLQTAFVRSQMQRLAEEVAEWDKRS
ncbi:MAG: phasin family protein [Hyphomicrobiaceae bacterium]